MNFIQKIWKLLAPFHKVMYGILILNALFESVRMAGPYLFGRILDILIASNGLITYQTALFVVGGLAGVRALSLAIDYIADFVIVRTLIKAEKHISASAFSKLLELSIDYHEKEATGKKITLVNKGTDKLINLLDIFLFEFQPTILQLIFTAIMMAFLSWRIGLIFSLSILPFVLITYGMLESTRKLRSKRHDAYEFVSGEVGDVMTNITVVKAFAQERRENKSYDSVWTNIRSIFTKEFRQRLIIGFGRSMVIEIFYLTILVLAIFEVRGHALTIGNLVFLINLLERAYSNVYRLGKIYFTAIEAAEPVDRITELMEKKSTVTNVQNPITPEQINGSIEFKNISFAYKEKKVLKNVSFAIPAGSFAALVGRSGSGKSTIAKLLSRYYDPTEGEILIDDKYDLKLLDLDTWRRETAVVFQDSPVPNRRIWEVISYAAGKKGFAAVEKQVIKAAQLAHAHEFILELEDGYQTIIGERGVKLSGGQKQRLAIARALFVEPKVLIMDEPTSHLDTLSEALIQKALEDISKERAMTKIVIAHRLSTVQKADQIFVMEKGRLVESGTHSQLLKNNGVYAQIVHQSELKA